MLNAVDWLILFPGASSIIFVVLIGLSFLGFFNNSSGPANYIPFIILFFGMISAIINFIVIIIHVFTQTFKLKFWVLKSVNKFYKKHRDTFVTSLIASIPIYLMFILTTFTRLPGGPIIAHAYSKLTPYILINFSVIFASFVVTRYIPLNRITAVLGSLFLLVIVGVIVWLIIIFVGEFMPKYYLTFPLDNKEARYIINYDGDYWLTEYKVNKKCVAENCTESLEKIGNTSIKESPVELMPYIDKPVHVTGKFVAESPESGDKKQFCINNTQGRKCRKSTGPGIWYASPLIIKTIELQ